MTLVSPRYPKPSIATVPISNFQNIAALVGEPAGRGGQNSSQEKRERREHTIELRVLVLHRKEGAEDAAEQDHKDAQPFIFFLQKRHRALLDHRAVLVHQRTADIFTGGLSFKREERVRREG